MSFSKSSIFICFIIVLCFFYLIADIEIYDDVPVVVVTNPVSLVDVFYGTGLVAETPASRGNIFPVISAGPHAYNHWTITTSNTSPWFFDRHSKRFAGIRCSHQPSPWVGDYSFFDINVKDNTRWNIEDSIVRPTFMSIKGNTHTLTLAPTNTGATVNIDSHTMGIYKLVFNGLTNLKVENQYTIYATAVKSSIYRAPQHTKLHVVIYTSVPITNDMEYEGLFQILHIGTSFIDRKHAEQNVNFKTIRATRIKNTQNWNHWLGKIQITNNSRAPLFYTILHRALLFPRLLTEGAGVHYSPYSKEFKVRDGPISTDSGFWDAYRTVYPLLHLAYPSLAKTILDGWVNAIKEDPNGLLPQWSSPGRIYMMEGSTGEISIAEGILNDAITDVDTAWGYLYKSCFLRGRESFDLYLMLGYVPGQVSLSLNYYLSDYVVSLAADKLGYHHLSRMLLERSSNWKLLFDSDETKFFRPKDIDGNFDIDFDPYRWMGPYREGSAWHYRFYVPHDPRGLNEEYGGQMCHYLSEMMTTDNTVRGEELIHEQVEMQEHSFGQYAHNNQPVHHVLYMFANVGCNKEGQRWLHHALTTQYGPEGYSGDEDNGEMAAWFILSTVGLYSLVPGSGKYQIGVPPPFKYVKLVDRGITITNPQLRTTWDYVTINGIKKKENSDVVNVVNIGAKETFIAFD